MPRKKSPSDLHAAAAALGRKGGLAKNAKLTATERVAIGKQLAEARKRIPAEERSRIAKAAVSAREAKRRSRGKPGHLTS